jgi:hypothetical protein
MAQDNSKKRGGVGKAQTEMPIITGLTITGPTITGPTITGPTITGPTITRLTIISLAINKYNKRPNPLFTVMAPGLLLSLNRPSRCLMGYL